MLFSLLNTPAAAVRPVPGAPGPGAPAAARVPKRRPHVLREGAARALFGTAAALSIAAVALICLFLLANGVPAMAEIGCRNSSSAPRGARSMTSTASSP